MVTYFSRHHRWRSGAVYYADNGLSYIPNAEFSPPGWIPERETQRSSI
jgi:hypothetical protein